MAIWGRTCIEAAVLEAVSARYFLTFSAEKDGHWDGCEVLRGTSRSGDRCLAEIRCASYPTALRSACMPIPMQRPERTAKYRLKKPIANRAAHPANHHFQYLAICSRVQRAALATSGPTRNSTTAAAPTSRSPSKKSAIASAIPLSLTPGLTSQTVGCDVQWVTGRRSRLIAPRDRSCRVLRIGAAVRSERCGSGVERSEIACDAVGALEPCREGRTMARRGGRGPQTTVVSSDRSGRAVAA
jgi:hypothetical protein